MLKTTVLLIQCLLFQKLFFSHKKKGDIKCDTTAVLNNISLKMESQIGYYSWTQKGQVSLAWRLPRNVSYLHGLQQVRGLSMKLNYRIIFRRKILKGKWPKHLYPLFRAYLGKIAPKTFNLKRFDKEIEISKKCPMWRIYKSDLL